MKHAACIGRSALFESTNSADHDEARAICLTCPMLADCHTITIRERDRARKTRTPIRGTWAGHLYGAPPIDEEAWTDDTARTAHAAYSAGMRDKRTKDGEKVYQRRQKWAARERAA